MRAPPGVAAAAVLELFAALAIVFAVQKGTHRLFFRCLSAELRGDFIVAAGGKAVSRINSGGIRGKRACHTGLGVANENVRIVDRIPVGIRNRAVDGFGLGSTIGLDFARRRSRRPGWPVVEPSLLASMREEPAG